MNIRPSAAIRQNYNEIADLCRTSQEPVYLTRNGEGDLVVMDMETFSRREKMLDLREQLLSVDEDRMAGNKGYTIDELDKYLDDAYLAKLHQITIIHGVGTGALRNAVQAHLKKSKYIKTYRMGEYGEGGYGVTVAEFK